MSPKGYLANIYHCPLWNQKAIYDSHMNRDAERYTGDRQEVGI